MQPNHAESPRSRQSHDWRDARGLVIEGEARVISRGPGARRETPAEAPAPRWGAALDTAAAAFAPAHPRLVRLALPAGIALVALAAFALSPAEAERHGSAEASVRVASAPVVR